VSGAPKMYIVCDLLTERLTPAASVHVVAYVLTMQRHWTCSVLFGCHAVLTLVQFASLVAVLNAAAASLAVKYKKTQPLFYLFFVVTFGFSLAQVCNLLRCNWHNIFGLA
jgi:hypothetical protein